MVAGAAAAFSIFHRAFLAVSVPALIPLIVRFALLGDELHNSMSAMVILFGVMIFFIARQGNAIMVTSLKLRFENRDLVSRLTARKANADKLNRDLLSEINERDRLGNELRNSERRLRHLSSELLMA
jgi:C4-dicarboxylate-specific signal transduction histidine kinase